MLCLGLLILPGCGGPGERPDFQEFSFGGPVMGTSYHIKVVLPAGAKLPEGISAGVHDTLEAINEKMSTYLPDSEISRFNQSPGPGWIEVSAQTAGVVAEAIKIGRLTGGALDITVGPLVDLWHFGPGHDSDIAAAPTDQEIEEVRSRVGLEAVEVRLDPPALFKKETGVRIDLSSIAKGYAVDQAAEFLIGRGISNFMIEVGGEIRVHGNSARGGAWNIAVEAPLIGVRQSQRIMSLKDMGVATSGDYRNYFEENGRRYSHIIDPQTGRPVTHDLASVTVLSPSCMQADGLATAILVLGPEKGWQLAVEQEWAVYLLIRNPRGLEQKSTAAFERLIEAAERD
jgi:thiamine biosynthesis lipoprotein